VPSYVKQLRRGLSVRERKTRHVRCTKHMDGTTSRVTIRQVRSCCHIIPVERKAASEAHRGRTDRFRSTNQKVTPGNSLDQIGGGRPIGVFPQASSSHGANRILTVVTLTTHPALRVGAVASHPALAAHARQARGAAAQPHT